MPMADKQILQLVKMLKSPGIINLKTGICESIRLRIEEINILQTYVQNNKTKDLFLNSRNGEKVEEEAFKR